VKEDPRRVRFAPSPTGSLHLGNARTALFNSLVARQSGGSLILRIEDTDVEREQPGSEAEILEDLRWLGVEWQEGPDIGGPCGPYRQSQRLELYRGYARRLLQAGLAYRCFCSEQTLREDAAARKLTTGQARYAGRCRTIRPEESARREQAGEPFALRFVTHVDPAADPEQSVGFVDRLRGRIHFPVKELGDTVIVRRDGRPTYNFAVVVDDAEMDIDLVLRGDDHLSNTPRQVLLFEALGRRPPEFAHLPMVRGTDGRRLSKRHGAASLGEYRRKGYPSEGVVNALALLGWAPGPDRNLIDPNDLVREFDVDRVTSAPAAFDPAKLDWVCNQHLQRRAGRDVAGEIERRLVEAGMLDRPLDPEWILDVAEMIRPGLSNFAEAPQRCRPLFAAGGEPLSEDGRSALAEEGVGAVVAALAEVARREPPRDVETWRRLKTHVAKSSGKKGKRLFRPMRVTITGEPSGPELDRLVPLIERGHRLCPDRIASVADRAERTLRWLA
jgi:glutamyl-tRNA synthetase